MISAVIYINLPHRTDRRAHMEEELSRMQFTNIHRVEGEHTPLNGHRGCALGHIRALELAKQFPTTLILEDDVVFTRPRAAIDTMLGQFTSLTSEWDVFLLGGFIGTIEYIKGSPLIRVLASQTAHAYLINNQYIDTLLQCFTESYERMGEELFFSETTENAIDQRWKRLQEKDKWYMIELCAQQKAMYSDIFHRVRDRTFQERFF